MIDIGALELGIAEIGVGEQDVGEPDAVDPAMREAGVAEITVEKGRAIQIYLAQIQARHGCVLDRDVSQVEQAIGSGSVAVPRCYSGSQSIHAFRTSHAPN